MPSMFTCGRGAMLAVLACFAGASVGSAADAPPAPVRHFDVLEYRVLGNTVLEPVSLERLLYPLLGTDKTLADVETARAALEQLYHDGGYATVYVDIPPQEVTNGIVRLRVTEGRLAHSAITGARFFSEPDVRAQLPAARTGTVLKIPELQQQLAQVNRQSADRAVVPILKAGSVPGTIDLNLQVHDHLPLHASLELNNQATIDTKPLRAIAALSYGNLFGRMDTLSVQYQATPQDTSQVRVIAANYAMHTLESGLQPSIFYIDSNSNVATVGTFGVLGKGQIAGSRFAYALGTGPATAQVLTLGLDYKHFRNTVTESGTTALVTPISYVNLSLGYAGSWRSEARQATWNISANAGPRGIANNPQAFANNRFRGRANYFYLRGDLATNLKLPAGFGLRLRLAGQEAFEPVISNESFSIAGADGVRGYLESEELGDVAIKGTVQLQFPDLRRNEQTLGDAYLYFDAGTVRIIDPLPGQPAPARLSSWGVGLDLLPGRKLTGSLTWARPLATGSVTRRGDGRFLFQVRGAL